jgi:hypothetical protein
MKMAKIIFKLDELLPELDWTQADVEARLSNSRHIGREITRGWRPEQIMTWTVWNNYSDLCQRDEAAYKALPVLPGSIEELDIEYAALATFPIDNKANFWADSGSQPVCVVKVGTFGSAPDHGQT